MSANTISKVTVWFGKNHSSFLPRLANSFLTVTGCSDGGFGAEICKKVVAAGHQLVATARNISSLSYLPSNDPRILALALDVTSTEAIKSAFAAAIEKFGHVDVVVNNAGYSVSGDTEAIPDVDARKEFDTNFWGTVNVTKEAVRVFREVNGKGVGGLVVQVTSLGGWVSFPGASFYHGRSASILPSLSNIGAFINTSASKFAIEGFTESISQEMPPDWNIKFLILEPGGMRTKFAAGSTKYVPAHPAYQNPSFPTRQLESFLQNAEVFNAVSADPGRTADVVVNAILNQDKRPLPLRLALGVAAYSMIKGKLAGMEKSMDEWKDVTNSTMSEEQIKIVMGMQAGPAASQ